MSQQTQDTGLAFGRDDDLGEIVGHLQPGDEVLLDDRSLPMEVFDVTDECIGSDMHPTRTVYLELRGRVYRLRGNSDFPNHEDTTPPMLELRKEGTWDSIISSVSHIEVASGQQIMSDTRAEDWLADIGISIR